MLHVLPDFKQRKVKKQLAFTARKVIFYETLVSFKKWTIKYNQI